MKTKLGQYLAQANVARLRFPLSDPRMAGIADRIGEMNRLAEESPGFVWRFQEDDSSENQLSLMSDYMKPFDESLLFFNMSVWTDEESLRDYVFRSVHKEMLQRRDSWVERLEIPSLVMWPVESNSLPSVREAVDRFQRLNEQGPTEDAFGFRR